MEEHIAKFGDSPWLTNGAKRVTGSSNVFGRESYMLAEVEKDEEALLKRLGHSQRHSWECSNFIGTANQESPKMPQMLQFFWARHFESIGKIVCN